MSPTDRTVVVVGQGYVGLPIAMRALDVGFVVVGYEIDEERVKRLQAGVSYIEDVSDDALGEAITSRRYLATSDVADGAGFDVAVITVPTPLREGVPDLSFIEGSAHDLAPYVTPGSTVILESTTYPGTTEELVGPILRAGSGLEPGVDFALGYSPERLDPGNTVWRLENTPKVVSGVSPESLTAVTSFYQRLVDQTVPVSSPRVAELSKLLENTFRHVNIALVNELATFAAELGVDVWEAIDAASTKPFGYMPFRPGPGVGGHCLPVDPSFLSWKGKQAMGSPFRFIELANDVNSRMPLYVAERVMLALNRQRKSVNGSRILVVGLAYKKNTGDGRESPASALCQELLLLGSDVRGVDPHLSDLRFPPGVTRVELTEEELREADITVITTDHDAFDYGLITESSGHVLDTRHRCAAGENIEYL